MVKIETEKAPAKYEDHILVTAPYSEEFVAAARALNGWWNGSTWNFLKGQEGEVREVLERVYGGTPTVRRFKNRSKIRLFGSQQVGNAPFAEGGALVEGVELVSGEILPPKKPRDGLGVIPTESIVEVRVPGYFDLGEYSKWEELT